MGIVPGCQSDKSVGVTTQFEPEDYMRKIEERYGSGYYKGHDIQLYYSPWYDEVINHTLFNDYIDATNYMKVAVRQDMEKSRFKTDFVCNEDFLTPKCPSTSPDLSYIFNYNKCVRHNITNIFKDEIPEFTNSLKNEESIWDFYYYISYVYGRIDVTSKY